MQRVEKLKRLIDCGGIYITSKANIFYYSGFTSEDAALVITEKEKILITDSRYIIQAKNQCPEFEIYNSADGTDKLFKRLGLKSIAFEEDYITFSRYERLKNTAKGAELIPGGKKISLPRSVKEAEEIEKIQAAEAIGDGAFSHVLNILHAGMTEKEAAFEIENYMRKNGASGTSFETIVASGVRSALPHGVASDKVIEKGDFVTMDFGCVLDGYCSDMTRTVVIGSADGRQREIYAVVLAAQKAALEKIRAGIACSEIDAAARKVITDAGYGKYFGHSLGHSVGLEIHENPNFSPRSEDITESGNVITVEPGIYIEDFGGVRIEDVAAILPENMSNLTKSEKNLIII